MTDFERALADLRRPKILIRAARAGVADYRRDRDLKRLVRDGRGSVPKDVMPPLLAEEVRLETNRTVGGAGYSIQRHVAVLTAILAEARRGATLPALVADACEAARPTTAPEIKSLAPAAPWRYAA